MAQRHNIPASSRDSTARRIRRQAPLRWRQKRAGSVKRVREMKSAPCGQPGFGAFIRRSLYFDQLTANCRLAARSADLMRWRERHPQLMRLLLLIALTLLLGGCTLPGTEKTESPTAVPLQTQVPPTATPQPTPTVAPTPTPRDNTPQEIYRRVSPAVVTILSRISSGGRSGTAFGTGIIIDRDGHILTNNHVVEGGQEYNVIFSDGTRVAANLVGTDQTTDLAILQVDGDMPGTASFGDSSKLEPGQPVVAIGSALGEFTNTITTGIISGLHRELEDDTGPVLQDMIQTDAAINPGNSGGPLLNAQGQVIGINTAIIRQSGQSNTASTAEGIGFATPSNLAKVVAERIIADGQIDRPDLGAGTTPVTPGLIAQEGLEVQQGALVTDVTPGGAADQAGIKAGDVIIAVDGKQVSKDNTLALVLLGYKPGDQIAVTVARGSQRFSAQVTLGGQ
jgi:serine protease Do